jgi:hypothetical protein
MYLPPPYGMLLLALMGTPFAANHLLSAGVCVGGGGTRVRMHAYVHRY